VLCRIARDPDPPLCQHIFVYCLGEFATKFENILGHESGAQIELFDEKKPEVENLVTLPL
jgi:hypothetical protein